MLTVPVALRRSGLSSIEQMMTDVMPSAATSDDNANLAFLIVAHHQPHHLARLVRALDDRSNTIFIHVDRKAPLAPFRAVVPEQSNVVFLEDRLEVEWGKLSVVQATLKLIDLSIASGPAFSRFTLLSGSDYPIKPICDIVARLRSSNCEYLRVDRRVRNDPADTHRHVVRDLPGGRYFDDLTPYHGSMHWSLTADCIRYVYKYMEENPGFLEFHRNVSGPDEVFFHTILMHSPFAAAITQDFSDGIYPDHTHHGIHFIDWTKAWPHMNLTLDERNLDDLLASTCLFARKFDEMKSRRLLDLLDAQVHKIRK